MYVEYNSSTSDSEGYCCIRKHYIISAVFSTYHSKLECGYFFQPWHYKIFLDRANACLCVCIAVRNCLLAFSPFCLIQNFVQNASLTCLNVIECFERYCFSNHFENSVDSETDMINSSYLNSLINEIVFLRLFPLTADSTTRGLKVLFSWFRFYFLNTLSKAFICF